MRTHQQLTGDRDRDWRALTNALADLCRRDPALYSRLVRQRDTMLADGVPAADVDRATLDLIERARGMPSA